MVRESGIDTLVTLEQSRALCVGAPTAQRLLLELWHVWYGVTLIE